MFGKKAKSKADEVDRCATRKVQKELEVENIEKRERELLAQRLRAEDDQGDLAAIDALLKDNRAKLDFARGAVDAAQDALERAAVDLVNERLQGLPNKRAEYKRLRDEIAAKAGMHIELAARHFECVSMGDSAQRARAVLVDHATAMGWDGAPDLLAQVRGQGKGLASVFMEEGKPLPDLAGMRNEISELDGVPGGAQVTAAVAKAGPVFRVWARALNSAKIAAGVKFDPVASWRKKQQAA